MPTRTSGALLLAVLLAACGDEEQVPARSGGGEAAAISILRLEPPSGPAAGGTPVVIVGAGFDGELAVAFGGQPAASVRSASSTSLTAVTAPAEPGAVDVKVRRADGKEATLPAGFVYVGPPRVDSVDPAEGPVAGGTLVSVHGSGFAAGARLLFNGRAAARSSVESPALMSGRAPDGEAGPADVRVENPDGQGGERLEAFWYRAPPLIVEVKPALGATGTQVEILGAGFRAGAKVFFGAAEAPQAAVQSEGRILAQAPPGEGVVSVSVVNADGQRDLLAGGFRYVAPPVLTEVEPARGRLSGGTPVTLFGSGFLPDATVRFGDRSAPDVLWDDAYTLRVTSPPATAPGPVEVVVAHPGGSESRIADGFTYLAPPAVDRVEPPAGPATFHTEVEIIGAGFEPGARAYFDEALVDAVWDSSTRLTAIAPPGIPGYAEVRVANPDGQEDTLLFGYRYVAPPTVTEMTPTSGPVEGGTAVTIRGADFADGAQVSFGERTSAAVVVESATRIRAVAPPASGPITVAVSVTNPDDQAAVLPRGFTYLDAPPAVRVDKVEPRDGPLAGLPVLITGAAFSPGATVQFGSGPAVDIQVLSAERIEATAPPVAAAGAVTVTVRNPDGTSGALPGGFEYLGPIPSASRAVDPDETGEVVFAGKVLDLGQRAPVSWRALAAGSAAPVTAPSPYRAHAVSALPLRLTLALDPAAAGRRIVQAQLFLFHTGREEALAITASDAVRGDGATVELFVPSAPDGAFAAVAEILHTDRDDPGSELVREVSPPLNLLLAASGARPTAGPARALLGPAELAGWALPQPHHLLVEWAQTAGGGKTERIEARAWDDLNVPPGRLPGEDSGPTGSGGASPPLALVDLRGVSYDSASDRTRLEVVVRPSEPMVPALVTTAYTRSYTASATPGDADQVTRNAYDTFTRALDWMDRPTSVSLQIPGEIGEDFQEVKLQLRAYAAASSFAAATVLILEKSETTTTDPFTRRGLGVGFEDVSVAASGPIALGTSTSITARFSFVGSGWAFGLGGRSVHLLWAVRHPGAAGEAFLDGRPVGFHAERKASLSLKASRVVNATATLQAALRVPASPVHVQVFAVGGGGAPVLPVRPAVRSVPAVTQPLPYEVLVYRKCQLQSLCSGTCNYDRRILVALKNRQGAPVKLQGELSPKGPSLPVTRWLKSNASAAWCALANEVDIYGYQQPVDCIDAQHFKITRASMSVSWSARSVNLGGASGIDELTTSEAREIWTDPAVPVEGDLDIVYDNEQARCWQPGIGEVTCTAFTAEVGTAASLSGCP